MKNLFFVLLCSVGICQGQDLQQLRTAYPNANESETITNELFENLSAISEKNKNTKLAYKGAILSLKAKFSKGIKNKRGYFKQGVKYIEDAITSEPKNIEIRCLRLGVQENSPKITGYKQNISEDKQFLIDHYPSVSDTKLQEFIRGYVTLSKVFTDTEKQLF